MPAARSGIFRPTFAEVEQFYFSFEDRVLCAKFRPAFRPLKMLRREHDFNLGLSHLSDDCSLLPHSKTKKQQITPPTEEIIQGLDARRCFSQLIFHDAN